MRRRSDSTDRALFPPSSETQQLPQKTPWGAIAICGFIALLGLGFIGSSTDNLFASPDADETGGIWENSMSVTADAVWTVINPSKSDRYVEIRPPVYITLFSGTEAIPSSPDQTPLGPEVEPNQLHWRIKIDNLTVEMSPALFTVVVVIFLLLFTLSCVLITSVLYSISKRRPGSRRFSNGLEDMGKSRRKWMYECHRVVGLSAGGLSDVKLLASSEASTVAWVDSDGLVHRWDVATFEHAVLPPKPTPVAAAHDTASPAPPPSSAPNHAAVSPSGLYVAAGWQDGALVLWEDAFMQVFHLGGAVVHVGFVPDDRLVAVSASGLVRTFARSAVGGEWEELPRLHTPVPDLARVTAFEHTCGTDCTLPLLLAVGYADGVVRVHGGGGADETVVLQAHFEEVTTLAFANDTALLLSGSVSGDVVVWSVKARKQVLCIPGDAAMARPLNAFDDAGGLGGGPDSYDGGDGRGQGGLVVGHRAPITAIRAHAPGSDTSPGRPADQKLRAVHFVTCSADHVAKVWRAVLSTQQPPRLVDVACLRTVVQPGCTAVGVDGDVVFGVRRASASSSSGEGGGGAPCWEVWMWELSERGRSAGASDAGMRCIPIGEDLLQEVGLATPSPMRRRRNRIGGASSTAGGAIDRAGAVGEDTKPVKGSRHLMPTAIGRRSEERGGQAGAGGAGGVGRVALVLPVLEVSQLGSLHWGVLVGFGNQIKLVVFGGGGGGTR
ncbi:hypothetical protein HDU96_004973 [Phlyctochytrium bullatum]|nr:hypothetical protein HDU96_004973 [Phlyctochytrium bullatum]